MPPARSPLRVAPPPPVRASAALLRPLDLGYARTGLAPPVARPIAAARIPSPYAALLTHETDMTRTLERHHGGRLLVRALATWVRRGWYCQRVLLVREASGRPVAMGAIRIRLDALAARVRARVLRGEVPLGRILRESGLEYRSRPRAFFEVTPNSEMLGVFWMREPCMLYGRRTEATLAGRGESRLGLRGTKKQHTEARRHGENPRNAPCLGASVCRHGSHAARGVTLATGC